MSSSISEIEIDLKCKRGIESVLQNQIPFTMSAKPDLPDPYRVISLRVLIDYENDWLINQATPSETTHVLTIGNTGFNTMRNEIITEYRASSDIDMYTKYKADIANQLAEYRQTESQKLATLEQTKDKKIAALQIRYDLLAAELMETKNNIKATKQQTIDELKAEYGEIISALKTERDNNYKQYKERIQEELTDYKNYKQQHEDKLTKLQNELAAFYTNRDLLITAIRTEYETKLQTERAKTEIFTGLNKTSTKKGSIGESATRDILHKLLPNAIILDTHSKPGLGDFHITYNNVNILYENKNFTDNVPKIDRDKFIKDVTNNSNINAGIMGSQQSGIGTKNNFEMEYTSNGKPLIYLHNTNENIEHIKIAIHLLCDNFNSVGNVSESKIKKIKNLLELIQQLTRETTQLQQSIEPLISLTRNQKQTIKNLEYKIKDIINEPDSITQIPDPVILPTPSQIPDPVVEIVNAVILPTPSQISQSNITDTITLTTLECETEPQSLSKPGQLNSLSLFKQEFIHTDLSIPKAKAITDAWKNLSKSQKKEYQQRARMQNKLF